MNERIKQLWELASTRYSVYEILKPQNERKIIPDIFAELIVKECIKVAVNKDSGYMHPADVAGYMAAGRSTAAHMIKEHFGVEE